MKNILLCFMTFYTLFIIVSSASYCCCCDVLNYIDMNRTWKIESDCQTPYKCCQIPTQEECEIQLNPTYDGTCGHNNEKKNQKKHGGVKPQKIPRPGVDYDLQGWFGQRLYDINGNEIEEWCIDNYNYDSFFLWRFVSCNGDYPHWFGRCAFPSATNILVYKSCDGDNFESTIPSCFGEIEEMNIGLGNDYGHDIDYRYDVLDETLAIWCTNHSNPKDPPVNSTGPAPGENDGMVPFELEKCRKFYPTAPVPFEDGSITNEEKSAYIDKYQYDNIMLPLTFRVNLIIKKLNNNFYEIIIHGNNMPMSYEAIINNGDSWSISLPQNIKLNNVFINENINNDWKYDINNKNNNYITFTYINNNNKSIHLLNNININGFIIEIEIKNNQNSNNSSNNSSNNNIGWIARSNYTRGTFVGFGSVWL